jgi:hypothetical protein
MLAAIISIIAIIKSIVPPLYSGLSIIYHIMELIEHLRM